MELVLEVGGRRPRARQPTAADGYDRALPWRRNPIDNTPRGRLRALYDWVTRAAPHPPSGPPSLAARTPPPDAALPARIGHYAITRKLGEGGMGVVYAARDERLERTVALKTMSSLAQRRDRAQALLARGARRGQRQPPERLPALRDRRGRRRAVHRDGAARGRVAGRAPAARAAERGRDACRSALGILAALAALHARGIVHRDLKPSNVFLTPHGVKLLDFGLARPSDPELARSLSSATELTRTGMRGGHAALHGARAGRRATRSTPARDLFAAGAILFEMLAGRPAFGGRNVVEILHAHALRAAAGAHRLARRSPPWTA